MQSLVPIIVIATITLGIYKLFELFVRKRERILIIEKLADKIGDKLDAKSFLSTVLMQTPPSSSKSFFSLKLGCLLIGLGIGLIIGFIIDAITYSTMASDFYNHKISEIIYGGSVLIFGGLGLLIAFFMEIKNGRQNKSE